MYGVYSKFIDVTYVSSSQWSYGRLNLEVPCVHSDPSRQRVTSPVILFIPQLWTEVFRNTIRSSSMAVQFDNRYVKQQNNKWRISTIISVGTEQLSNVSTAKERYNHNVNFCVWQNLELQIERLQKHTHK